MPPLPRRTDPLYLPDRALEAMARARDTLELPPERLLAPPDSRPLPLKGIPLEGSRNGKGRPVVSVVIPCYNQGRYLPDAVQSVLAQTHPAIEIIIVDDGSTDDTPRVGEQFSRAHSAKVRFLRKPNGGLASARNDGILRSSGEYILPLDADDELSPDFLEKTVEILETDRGVDIVSTWQYRFGEEQGVEANAPFDPRGIFLLNSLNYCSLYRRSVPSAVGGYEPYMAEGMEDWEFWISAVRHGFRVTQLREPLFRYRIRSGSMLCGARKKMALLSAKIVRFHPDAYSVPCREWASSILRIHEGKGTAWDFLAAACWMGDRGHWKPVADLPWETVDGLPGSRHLYHGLARSLSMDHLGAIQSLEEHLSMHPEDPLALFFAGWSSLCTGDIPSGTRFAGRLDRSERSSKERRFLQAMLAISEDRKAEAMRRIVFLYAITRSKQAARCLKWIRRHRPGSSPSHLHNRIHDDMISRARRELLELPG